MDDQLNAAPADLMISERMLDDLAGGDASIALVDLFALHGRRPWLPESPQMPRWQGRGARQRFARAVAVLHVKGYIRWLPGGRYKIITDAVMTVTEYRARQSAENRAGNPEIYLPFGG